MRRSRMEETILEFSLFSKDSQSGNIPFDTQDLNEDIYFVNSAQGRNLETLQFQCSKDFSLRSK